MERVDVRALPAPHVHAPRGSRRTVDHERGDGPVTYTPRLPGSLTGRASKQYGNERRCAICDRQLSTYNPDAHCRACYIHVPHEARPTIATIHRA